MEAGIAHASAERDDQAGHRVVLDRGWHSWRLMGLRSAGMPFGLLTGLAPESVLAMPTGSRRDALLRSATRTAMNDLLLDDTIRTALVWQNPDIIDNWVGGYVTGLRSGNAPRLSEMDRREAVVARYAQRYCAKNDTIGFFGPVAWARWSDAPSRQSGQFGIRRSAVSFEVWAIQAIAHRWNNDPALRAHLPIRLDPACSVVDGLVRRPHRPPVRLDKVSATLIKLLPEVDSVGELESRWGDGMSLAIDHLRAERVVHMGFRIPLDSHPELALRKQVDAVADPSVRTRLCAVLDGLESARNATANADDPEQLRRALAEVDVRLASAAGRRVRPGGELAPGGRTPVYLDCRRDLDVMLSTDLLRGLAGPLGVLLDSARWLAGQVGETVEHAVRDRYRQLSARRTQVTLADLHFACADLLEQGTELLADVVDDFQARWAEILPSGHADADVPLDEARRMTNLLFPREGGRLWAAARAHTPDLMLRRPGGTGAQWVLGELHVAMNTLESRFFRTQADDEDELVHAVSAGAAEGRVVPVYPNSSREVSSRMYPPLTLDPPGHYRYWSYGSDDGHASGVPSTPATALHVHECAGQFLATCPGGWAAPVLECFGEFLTALVVNLFQIRPTARYLPRVTIADLVVCRKSWRIPITEIGALPTRATDAGHDRLRDRARRLDLPRHAFVRTLPSTKPFYVDFAAPTLVDNLARAIRRVADRPDHHIELVEMLPGPEELWLTGPSGERYTSEFRMVTVDAIPHPPASWRSS